MAILASRGETAWIERYESRLSRYDAVRSRLPVNDIGSTSSRKGYRTGVGFRRPTLFRRRRVVLSLRQLATNLQDDGFKEGSPSRRRVRIRNRRSAYTQPVRRY